MINHHKPSILGIPHLCKTPNWWAQKLVTTFGHFMAFEWSLILILRNSGKTTGRFGPRKNGSSKQQWANKKRMVNWSLAIAQLMQYVSLFCLVTVDNSGQYHKRLRWAMPLSQKKNKNPKVQGNQHETPSRNHGGFSGIFPHLWDHTIGGV